MNLNRLQESLAELREQKREALERFDSEIEALEFLAADFDIRERISLPLGKAVLLNDTEKFLAVTEHLLGCGNVHVGFKTFEQDGEVMFSVRLNLIEQLIVNHYGAFESECFKARTRELLKKWKKQGVPLTYRRTSSIDLTERKSNKYPSTYAVEMSKKTFEQMVACYLETNGEEVWRWNERRKSQ